MADRVADHLSVQPEGFTPASHLRPPLTSGRMSSTRTNPDAKGSAFQSQSQISATHESLPAAMAQPPLPPTLDHHPFSAITDRTVPPDACHHGLSMEAEVRHFEPTPTREIKIVAGGIAFRTTL